MIKLFRFLFIISFALLIGLGVGCYIAIYHKMPLPTKPIEFVINEGDNLKLLSARLSERKLIISQKLFELMIRIKNKDSQIKSGLYLFNNDVNLLELIEKITQGETKQFVFRFIEGTNSRQLLESIKTSQNIKKSIVNLPSEAQMLRQLDITSDFTDNQDKLEGLFMPNTYFLAFGTSDITILKQSHKLLRKHLMTEWDKRDRSLPYQTPYQALIMASIIEKETSDAEERALVASVFINRLRLGMKLQTDPTVIYGMGKNYQGTIHKKDLQADTPYNTYTRLGLPPTPIAMVSLEAIKAALNPADTAYLYFVAKSKEAKTHHFSKTYEEHLQHVQDYVRSLNN